MKIVGIGDIHGMDIWKKIVKKESEADKFIFLGDYFDTYLDIWPIDQLKNFEEIVKFKTENNNKAELLFGNHDFHYLPWINEHYSGFQSEMAFSFSEKLVPVFNEGLLKICFKYDDYLFSHAGFTKTWCNYAIRKDSIDDSNDIEAINKLLIEQPAVFKFRYGVRGDWYGDDITQGPLWVRPRSLGGNSIDGYHQVIGHTIQEHIRLGFSKHVFIDALLAGEYLVIEDIDNTSVIKIGILKDKEGNV